MCLGLIGEIVAIEGEGTERKAMLDGSPRSVSLLTLPEARLGDTISVHAGFGVAVVEQGVRSTK
jgi:hydrogenase maturation factor